MSLVDSFRKGSTLAGMPSFAFFDLDHTLLPFDTQTLFANFILKRERLRTSYLVRFAPVAILRAAKLVPTVIAKRAFMGYLHGMRQAKLAAYAREFADEVVLPWTYPDLMKEVAHHRSEGRVLILNTASPDFYAHEIARALGFDHCVATKVHPQDPMPYLPQVVGSNNKREAKIAAMKIAVPSVAAASVQELQDSWAYSDSAADLPLLELAGNAVLVHPNAALEALGLSRGWQIRRPTRPYRGKAGDVWSSARQALGIYSRNAPPSA